MLTCSLCAKMGHIKTDCHLKTQNSWVILVPKGQKIPIYLEAIKDRPRKRKKTRNGVYLIQNSTKVDLYKIRLPEKSTYSKICELTEPRISTICLNKISKRARHIHVEMALLVFSVKLQYDVLDSVI